MPPSIVLNGKGILIAGPRRQGQIDVLPASTDALESSL